MAIIGIIVCVLLGLYFAVKGVAVLVIGMSMGDGKPGRVILLSLIYFVPAALLLWLGMKHINISIV